MQNTTAILQAVGFAAECLGEQSWEKRILSVLAKLADATNASRTYVFENHKDEQGVLLTSLRYEWSAPNIPSQLNNPDLQDSPYQFNGFLRWAHELGQGQVIHGLVENLPGSERTILAAQGIISIVVVPIFVGSEWWGFIGFDDCVEKREWNHAEIEAHKAAANIFSAAIQRKRMAQLEKRLVQLATYDDLTGVPNRRALKEAMDHEHARAKRTNRPYCLALIDLDRFKVINDSYGHGVGDQVLVSTVQLFKESLRKGDWIGRCDC